MLLPLPVVLRKVRQKMLNWAGMKGRRWRALFLGTTVSDAKFLRSLGGQFASLQSFLNHVLSREEPRFFLDPGRRHEFLTAIHDCCPQAEASTVAAANRVCDHLFDLLGSGPTFLGEKIDWHADFATGHRFDPSTYYADVRSAPYPGGYDIKVPWELSRCQHFAWLGQAYWFTGDEKYAGEFVAQVLDWVEQNLPQLGVNWACTMDVAIRAVNWLWGYSYFKHSPSLTDRFRLAFFKSLLVHGRHIMSNLEWSETLTSNHYLSDIVGLVYLGIMLPEFKEAQRWREFGLQELEREIFKQVYPDGVDFEASVSYHRLAAELFLSAVLLARLNGHIFSRSLMERLEKMLEFTMYVTKPDGTVPLIGDADNGRVHRLKVWGEPEREWVDHRYLLAIGAVLFAREDFAQAAGDQWEEAFWLFGEEALRSMRGIEARAVQAHLSRSRAFPEAGLYVMRDDDLYLIVDAGQNGQNGNGGHAHNDTLSFELYAYGQTWLVDPGTYAYTADYAARNLFRSSAYHNVVVVDGLEISSLDPHRLFSMPSDVPVRVNRWVQEEEYDVLDVEQHGYRRLPGDIVHRRQVCFDKSVGFWVLRDLLTGAGHHIVSWVFHLAPGVVADTLPDGRVMLTKMGLSAQLMIVPSDMEQLSVQTQTGWVSLAYGSRRPASIVEFTAELALPVAREFVLYPSTGNPQVEYLENEQRVRKRVRSALGSLSRERVSHRQDAR